jgi:hypothetical protein
MGGGGTETSTQTNAPSNPDVNPTLSKLLKGVQTTYDRGVSAGNPTALTSGWASQLGAAANPDYARGVAGSTRELADIASGNRFGTDDPGYAALRQGAIDDTLTNVNSSFLTDGRFGSTVQGEAAGRGVAQTIAGLDYGNFQNDQQRQMQAIQALPTTFAAGQAPGSVQASVGQQQQQAPWANLANASSILAGTAGAGGSTSTMTQPATPWWQQVLGAGAIGSGIYKNVWGS